MRRVWHSICQSTKKEMRKRMNRIGHKVKLKRFIGSGNRCGGPGMFAVVVHEYVNTYYVQANNCLCKRGYYGGCDGLTEEHHFSWVHFSWGRGSDNVTPEKTSNQMCTCELTMLMNIGCKCEGY